MRQSLQNETKNSCYKVTIKCEKSLLQSVAVTTKWRNRVGLFTQLANKCSKLRVKNNETIKYLLRIESNTGDKFKNLKIDFL